MWQRIAELMLEGCFLKHIPRSGYQYLGTGRESVAEHVYQTAFIAFLMSRLVPLANTERLISMCLLHDFPEARTGDLNYVQKAYVSADETKALADSARDLPFAADITDLINEFKAGQSLEARLARDADQLALMVDLKSLNDIGYQTPQTWLPHVQERLQTDVGRQLAEALLGVNWDSWWRKLFSVDSNAVLP
jgi:putative hydrolases of HD superfamily